MKRTMFFLVFGMLVLNAQAKIWRVNNSPSVSADFSDINTAISTASEGDTLYVEGSSTQYADATLNKQLCLTGPGHTLAYNDSTVYNKNSASINTLTISSTANGSIIIGLWLKSLIIGANNLVIERNYIQSSIKDATNNLSTFNNSTIRKNFIGAITNWQNGGANFRFSNFFIANNIMLNRIENCINSTIINNISGEYVSVYGSVIQNNIVKAGIYNSGTNSNNTLQNNLYNFSTATIFSSLFIGGSVPDKAYNLSTTSSAKGAGIGGIDCGAFGGNDPYVLSGLPAIPHIYDIVAPTSGSATSGLAVKVKVKTQK